ncbi:MAG: hypothetical protein C0410_10435 [Anaerolinea sp.]|nr:hypothetical protein [Anaerolinea sp.]
MAEKKLERRTSLDPAVADLLSGMEQRQAESQLPRKERERLGRERAKIQSRREQRATYDLPPTLREDIRVMSEDLRIPASQLVTLALARFLNEYNSGTIDLGKYKQPSRSPRYDWNLVFPDEIIRIKKKKG